MFTALLILVGMGATLYFVSTATVFLLEGQLGHVFRRKKMQRELASMRDHMIVCGAGPTAIYATAELFAVERTVVLIVPVEADIQRAREALPSVPIVLGDPTEDEILRAAGIERASGVIACSASDNENVVITLTARHLNPDLRIVSRLSDVDHESKIRKVGADAVVSPQHIGGLRLASELIRPAVVSFLDTMLRDRQENLRVDEIFVPSGASAIGQKINDIHLEDIPGVLLLAIRDRDGSWEYNPPRRSTIREGTTLIVLGSPQDCRSLTERLGGTTLGSR
jgi:voltage-gated potassium channel